MDNSKMSAWDCYVESWRKYATFTGRASRREFWFAFMFFAVISMLLLFLSIGIPLVGVLRLVFQLASTIPMLALSVRRLHDIGHSWWLLLFGLFPGFGPVIVLYVMCRRGQEGVNQYGEDPRRTQEHGF